MATAPALTLEMIKINVFISQLVTGLGAQVRAGILALVEKQLSPQIS